MGRLKFEDWDRYRIIIKRRTLSVIHREKYIQILEEAVRHSDTRDIEPGSEPDGPGI